MSVYQQAATDLQTIRDFLRFGVSLFNQHKIFCGHGFVDPWDEAVALVLHTLNLSHDMDNRVLDARLLKSEKEALSQVFKRRAEDRVPTAYLTNEAWFASLPFYVNEHVLVPRSPIGELIEGQFSPWLQDEKINRVLDLCTGSGCIAIASSMFLPNADVTATDISPEAIAVAKRNIEDLGVGKQVTLLQSDVWENVPKHKYDIIVSNPPYVASQEYAGLPQEYLHEPKLGLEIRDEGLAIVEEILQKASDYLTDHGILIVEVGSAQEVLISRYPKMPFCWLEFARGGEGVFLLHKSDLDVFYGR